MKYFGVKNFLLVFVVISLLSVKFYYLHLYNVNYGYSVDTMYAGGDASHYLLIAKNIAEYGVYSDNNSAIPSIYATWRPPLWPLVLSILFKFTSKPLGLIILKAVLETVLLLIILFKFKQKQNLNLISFLPFCLVSIEPQYLKYSITFLSESFTAVLILILIISFVYLGKDKRYEILIPILSAFVILSHPVAVFFIFFLFSFYIILNLNSNFRKMILYSVLFSFIILVWPIRNNFTFAKGFYLTVSQGAALSKGWNEKVLDDFTNVDGDLADETLNLKFLDKALLSEEINNSLLLSNLYFSGTVKFIKGITIEQMIKIGFKKILSNFNPFPEKPKLGFLEVISVFFRILYLVVYVQMFFRFSAIHKMNFKSDRDRIYLVILSIFLGQVIMSVVIYTGLRFNAIYSLTLFFCFIYLNSSFLSDIYYKLEFLTIKHLIK